MCCVSHSRWEPPPPGQGSRVHLRCLPRVLALSSLPACADGQGGTPGVGAGRAAAPDYPRDRRR